MNKNGSIIYHRKLLSNQNNQTTDTEKESKTVKVKAEEKKEPLKLTHQQREKIANKVEMTARILLPTTYIIFNVFYWITYLNDVDYEND